jgi:nucleotide-binding universal stress UspA family protein
MMDRFKNILVAAAPGHVDTAVLHDTIRLARRNRAQLTLLDVMDPLPPWRRSVNVEGRIVEIQDLLMQDRSDRFRHVVETAGGGHDVAVEVITGKPFVEVIRYVVDHQCDLVIVGEPEHDHERHPGVGAGVMQLLRKCPVPVWVMRPRGEAPLRVLALVDPDPSDPVRDGLNDLVLELAVAMVEDGEGELHVAHAWLLEGEATLRTSEFVSLPGEEVDLMVDATGREHQRRLEALAARHPIDAVGGSIHLVSGDPGRILPEMAARLHATVIVMGTVARTGLVGLIMGNTAETILRAVHCSVLAVKPVGFVSPVHLEHR